MTRQRARAGNGVRRNPMSIVEGWMCLRVVIEGGMSGLTRKGLVSAAQQSRSFALTFTHPAPLVPWFSSTKSPTF